MRSLLRILVIAIVPAFAGVLPNRCAAEPGNLVPMRRFHNAQANEHVYTTDDVEAAKWRKLKQFSEQVIVGFVAPSDLPGTVRLYRGTKPSGRQVYFVGERPGGVQKVDDTFKAYVWRTGDDGRVGVYSSTWTDGGDVYFDDLLEYIEKYSANTVKNLNVSRLRPQQTPTFFVYPSPRRQAIIAQQTPKDAPDAKVSKTDSGSTTSTMAAKPTPRIVATPEADDDTVRFKELLLDDPVTCFEMTEDGRHVLFTHQLANRVSVYDVLRGEVTKVIESPSPRSVICRGEKTFIANFGTGTISVYDRSLDWRLAAKLRTLKPDIVHLSAARGAKFNDELLVTCHGPGPEASYRDSHIMVVDVRRNLCRNLSSDPVAIVSTDATLVFTQGSFNLSPSGGIKGWDYSRFTTPGAQRDPVIQGGVSQTPSVYQIFPGSYLLGQNTIFGGTSLQQMPGDFGNLIVPDLAQKLFYTLTANVIRAHAYDAVFSQVDLRPIKYPTGYEDINQVVFPIQRIREYKLDHPAAYTHGDRLYLFVLTSTAGRVLIAETPALRPIDLSTTPIEPKGDSTSVAAKEEMAALDKPKDNSSTMPGASGGTKEPAASLGETRKGFADVIDRCEPAVVRIETKGNDGDGIGSGFVVDDRGTVVTNCHVLVGANEARVQFADGSTAEVIGTLAMDEARDIAIIKISSIEHRSLAFSADLPRKGEEVIALGAPLGLAFTATRGIVSAIRSEEEFAREFGSDRAGTWIQVDTALSPGNSGGPLINDSGQVVAMATLASTGIAQNLNFGISAADIVELLKGAWTSTLLPLADGAAKMKAPKRSRSSEGESAPDLTQVPADALRMYLKACEQQYVKLVRDLQKEGSRLNKMLQEMKKGEPYIPDELRDDGDIVSQQSPRGVKWYFRSERVKDRAIDFVSERIDEIKELLSSLKGANDRQSVVNLAANYGPFLDGRDVGKVGFLSEAVVLSAVNDTDVLIVYEGAIYLINLDTTAGIASGDFLQARPAYVVGTATVKSPRGGSSVVTLLRSVSKDELETVASSGQTDKPASKATDAKQVIPKDSPDSAKSPEPARTWRGKDSKYSVVATLVDFDAMTVKLRKEDGSVVSVSTSYLCAEDIEYLKQKWQAKKASEAK